MYTTLKTRQKNNQGSWKGRKNSPKTVVQYSNLENPKICPVCLFKLYRQLHVHMYNVCPTNCPDDVFYLQTLLKQTHTHAGQLSQSAVTCSTTWPGIHVCAGEQASKDTRPTTLCVPQHTHSCFVQALMNNSSWKEPATEALMEYAATNKQAKSSKQLCQT